MRKLNRNTKAAGYLKDEKKKKIQDFDTHPKISNSFVFLLPSILYANASIISLKPLLSLSLKQQFLFSDNLTK